MSLTVRGFAPERTVALRGKGGNRARGDNGVSSLAPGEASKSVDTRGRADPASRRTTAAVIQTTERRRAEVREGTGAPRAHKRRPHRARPAALEWREVQVPLLGRLWATAWLPSILLAGCMVALIYLLQTSGVATTGYDIQSLQAQRDDWQLRNEQLQLELSKRRSLTWIEAEASGRLGMVRPEPTTLTYIRVGR